jgi:hypothetical protein
VTAAIYDNCHTCRNGCPRDAGDKCGPVSLSRTDANGSRLTRNSRVADVDIVIARGEINAGFGAYRDVIAAGCVALKRPITVGRVIEAGCVAT